MKAIKQHNFVSRAKEELAKSAKIVPSRLPGTTHYVGFAVFYEPEDAQAFGEMCKASSLADVHVGNVSIRVQF